MGSVAVWVSAIVNIIVTALELVEVQVVVDVDQRLDVERHVIVQVHAAVLEHAIAPVHVVVNRYVVVTLCAMLFNQLVVIFTIVPTLKITTEATNVLDMLVERHRFSLRDNPFVCIYLKRYLIT